MRKADFSNKPPNVFDNLIDEMENENFFLLKIYRENKKLGLFKINRMQRVWTSPERVGVEILLAFRNRQGPVENFDENSRRFGDLNWLNEILRPFCFVKNLP